MSEHIHPSSVEVDNAIREILKYMRESGAVAATGFHQDGTVILVDMTTLLAKVKQDNPNCDPQVLLATFMSVYLHAVFHEFNHVLNPDADEKKVEERTFDIIRRLTGEEEVV